jgi:simple sugar transport system ATP-binding protein
VSAETGMPAVAPILELENVCMDFGHVRALTDVSLSVGPGEVVGLIGDNGAGKSTLVKILNGFQAPSQGTMRFAGEPVRFSSPAAARARGIETVFQNLALVDELALWRNFFLGKELRGRLGPLSWLRAKEMRAICLAALHEIGLTRVDSADEAMQSLSGGERQSLAITRAVHFGARVLLLDEPTAALSVRETRHVIASIEAARKQGIGIVYIDHNLAHVHPIADRIVLIEQGRVADVIHRGTASLESLIEMLARNPTTSVTAEVTAEAARDSEAAGR